MATPLATGSAANDAARYTTAEIQPSPNALILAFVSSVRRPLAAGTLTTPALSSPGLTWEVVDTIATADNERRLTCLRARGPAPARGPVVITFGDQIQDLCAWSLVEYADVDATGVSGSGAIGFSKQLTGTGTRLDGTFAPADPTRDRTIAAILLRTPTGTQAPPVTPGAGFTEIHEQTPSQPAGKALALQTQDAAPGVTAVGWTWTGSQDAVALVVGIKAARTGNPVTGNPSIDFARQYEPILYLHPSESFVPVNAKRYVEAAALWAAKAPFDDKNSWGTTPLVKSGQLSAIQTEPGDFLGKPDHILADTTNERFLEVGGWKNSDEASEPGVSASSTNPYVDRQEILRRYGTDLADSKFWYHVELFDTARLKTLAGASTSGLDLATTLSGNFANPILLCYYFFYPAHEQSVGDDGCPNIEAKEFASHAGDWHCYAVLLDGEGPPSPDTYTPLFFGITGSRPVPDTTGAFRPHAFDAEGRIALKVEPWRKGSAATPVQPDVVEGHPQFYVARGSHSMYTTPGDHEVSPYQDSKVPAGCGRYDSPSAVPPATPDTPGTPAHTDSFTENGWVILLVKMRAGFVLGPIGALVGLVAGIIEGIPKATTPFGVDGAPPTTPPGVDPPNPDAAPTSSGQGITLRPKELAIPGISENLFDWESAQAVSSPAGRNYDFVVDRAAQVWWPSDDGTTGFRGRWGQRVTSDPVPHRAGVKFPEFWKMMLTALEQGFGEGTLPRP